MARRPHPSHAPSKPHSHRSPVLLLVLQQQDGWLEAVQHCQLQDLGCGQQLQQLLVQLGCGRRGLCGEGLQGWHGLVVGACC